MKLFPIKHAQCTHRRIALVKADDADPRADYLYIPRDLARSWLRAGIGSAYARRGIMTRYVFDDGRSAWLLPVRCDAMTDAELAMAQLWVESHGARMSSVQGTAISLLRASLDVPLTTPSNGPPLARVAGGRIHSGHRMLAPSVEVWDIRAAFASTLAAMHPCGYWRHGRTLHDWRHGFVTATVYVPDCAQWGPLPIAGERRRLRTLSPVHYPQDDMIAGTWTMRELRTAVTLGARIRRIDQSWTLYADTRLPFALWWEWLADGRRLPGNAGAFLKAVSQSIWGVFAANAGGAERVWYENGKRRTMPVLDPPILAQRRDLSLADQLSATIRDKVYRELILPRSNDVFSVATDGGLVAPGIPPVGAGWRLKDRGERLMFRSATLYAYDSTVTGSSVHIASGLSENAAASLFAHLAHAGNFAAGADYAGPWHDATLGAVANLRRGFPRARMSVRHGKLTDVETGGSSEAWSPSIPCRPSLPPSS